MKVKPAGNQRQDKAARTWRALVNAFNPDQRRDESGRWVEDPTSRPTGNAFDESKHRRDDHGRFANKRKAPARGHALLTHSEREASLGALRASEAPVLGTAEWLRGDVGMRGSIHARRFHNVLGRVKNYLGDIQIYSSDLTKLTETKYSVRGYHQLLRDRHVHIADALEHGLLAYPDYHHHRATLEKIISDHRFAAAVHRDAAEEITNNAFNPDQPRSPDGRWRGARGDYDPTRGGVQDSELVERLQSSEAAADVTGVLVYDWSNSLLPEAHESLYHDYLTESAHNKLLQAFSRIAEPLHRAGAMAYGARKAVEKFRSTGDQTFADEASLDHGRIRNALLRAQHEVATLEQTDQVKVLARRIQEAVALNHDASEMLVGNASGDNCGTGDGGFKPGNTCGHKSRVAHEVSGHHGAAWRGNVSGHVTRRAAAQPARALGEDSQWRTQDEEYEASQGARHVTEDATEAVHQFLDNWKTPRRMEEERNTLYHLALVAADYANKAALYSRQGSKEYVEPGHWQHDYKASGSYHQLASQSHIRLVNELRRNFLSSTAPGVRKSDVQRIIDRNLLAAHMHRDAGLMLTGNAGNYEESKHKRDNAGKFSSTGGGGGSPAPRTQPVAPQAPAAEEPYQPRQRLQDAQGGAAYTEIREALQADVLTRPLAGVLGTVSSKFQTGVDKQYNDEVKETFKGIFSRLTLGTGPLVVKAVAAGVRQSPRLFRLLVQGMQEAGKAGAAAGKGITGNAFDPGQARDANGRWSKSLGQKLYGAAEKAGVVAGLGAVTWSGVHSLMTAGANAGIAGVGAYAGSGAVASPVAMGASMWLPAAGSVGLSTAGMATVAGATGVGLLAMPLIVGLATKGRAGGMLNEDAYNEMTEVFQGIFSRMTLGTGPLAVRATAAGIRHSPKLFRLLVRGLNEAASGATAVGRGLGHAAVGVGQGLAAGYRAATHNSFDPNQPRDDLGRWSLEPYGHSGHTRRQHEVNRPHSTLRPTQTMLEEEQEAAKEAWKVDDLATTATARVINPLWESRRVRFLRGPKEEALNWITHDNERASNYSWMAKDMALKEDLDSVPPGRDDKYTYRDSVVAYLDAASTRRERIAEALGRYFMDSPGATEAVRLNREAAALLRDAASMTQR